MSVLVLPMSRAEPPPLLRAWLLTVAGLEVWSAIADLPAGFAELDPGLSLLMRGDLLIAPFFAIAALAFAVGGACRLSIIASSLLTLTAALCDLPLVLMRGLDVTPDPMGLEAVLAHLGAPAAATVALLLVLRNTGLGAAALLAGLPIVLATGALFALPR